jgi:hypothetical protein
MLRRDQTGLLLYKFKLAKLCSADHSDRAV